MASELGLPVPFADADHATEIRWKELEDLEDAEVLARFPALAHPPTYRQPKPTHTPFRLHRAMVPPNDSIDDSIVFLGNDFRAAEVQALWAVAYLDGNLYPPVPKPGPTFIDYWRAPIVEEAAKAVAWCRRRYLNKGELGSWFYLHVVEFTDMLLAELGLSSHKWEGWLSNFFAPCRAEDLRALVREYKSPYLSRPPLTKLTEQLCIEVSSNSPQVQLIFESCSLFRNPATHSYALSHHLKNGA